MCALGHDKCKRPGDIAAGDVIMFSGTPHLIAEIEPYTHPTLGPMVGIARAGDGWGITLAEPVCVEVA